MKLKKSKSKRKNNNKKNNKPSNKYIKQEKSISPIISLNNNDFKQYINEQSNILINDTVYYETTPRIRVGFHGDITSIKKENTILVELPSYARVRKDGKLTFMQTKINVQEMMISGLWYGGSRDLSNITPRTIYYPFNATSTIGKYDLEIMNSKTDRVWYRGSIQETAINDKLAYFHSLGISSNYRELRDAEFASQIRYRSVTRCLPSGSMFMGGDTNKMFYKCKQMQSSYWAMFFSRFWYIVNTMGVNTAELYPVCLGFMSKTNQVTGHVELFIDPNIKSNIKLNARKEILNVSNKIGELVFIVLTNIPCLLKPWQGVNIHYDDISNMRSIIENVHNYILSTDLFSLIPRNSIYDKTITMWKHIIYKLKQINVYYLCALYSTSILQGMFISDGVMDIDKIPCIELGLMCKYNPIFYGYNICYSEYKRCIEDNSVSPYYAHTSYDNDKFTALLSKGKESPYIYQHPYVYFNSILHASKQESSNTSINETNKKINYYKSNAVLSLFYNALGPNNKKIMKQCMDQAIEESLHVVKLPDIKNVWSIERHASKPSYISIKTDKYQNLNNFNHGAFVYQFTNVLFAGNLGDHVSKAPVLNVSWFSRIKIIKGIKNEDCNGLISRIAKYRMNIFLTSFIEHYRNIKLTKIIKIQSFIRNNIYKLIEKRKIIKRNELIKSNKMKIILIHMIFIFKFIIRIRLITFIMTKIYNINYSSYIIQYNVRNYLQRIKLNTYSTKIQSIIRMKLNNIYMKQLLLSVIKIQSIYRGNKERHIIILMKQNELNRNQYITKVNLVVQHLCHVFRWDHMIKDEYMLRHILYDGTIPFDVILSFPRIQALLYNIIDPYQFIIDAANVVGHVYINQYGLCHKRWSIEANNVIIKGTPSSPEYIYYIQQQQQLQL